MIDVAIAAILVYFGRLFGDRIFDLPVLLLALMPRRNQEPGLTNQRIYDEIVSYERE